MATPTRPLQNSFSSISDVSVAADKVPLAAGVGVAAVAEGILVTAHPNNTAVVRISGTDVTSSQGQPLGPGASWTFNVANANLLYAVAESGTQTVCASPA